MTTASRFEGLEYLRLLAAARYLERTSATGCSLEEQAPELLGGCLERAGLVRPQTHIGVDVGGGPVSVVVRAPQDGLRVRACDDDAASEGERRDQGRRSLGVGSGGVADESGDGGDLGPGDRDLAPGVVGRAEVHQVAGGVQNIGPTRQVNPDDCCPRPALGAEALNTGRGHDGVGFGGGRRTGGGGIRGPGGEQGGGYRGRRDRGAGKFHGIPSKANERGGLVVWLGD